MLYGRIKSQWMCIFLKSEHKQSIYINGVFQQKYAKHGPIFDLVAKNYHTGIFWCSLTKKCAMYGNGNRVLNSNVPAGSCILYFCCSVQQSIQIED